MNSRTSGRLIALACALAGSALLQGCAIATGPYLAQRGSNANRSMVSNYDALGQPITHRSSVSRTLTVMHDKGGLHDFRYY